MLEYILGILLQGYISNNHGYIGVRVARDGGVIYVHPSSPAEQIGILPKDKILEADGEKGIDLVDGMSGTYVDLKVKRGKDVLYLKVKRVLREEFTHK